jgi:hypothetical protein
MTARVSLVYEQCVSHAKAVLKHAPELGPTIDRDFVVKAAVELLRQLKCYGENAEKRERAT